MSKNATQDSEQLTDAMFYILLALLKERHGYAIMKYIQDLSDGTMHMGPGTLYTLLKKLSTLQWIQQQAGQERMKTYVISEAGKQILEKEIKRRERMLADARKAFTEVSS